MTETYANNINVGKGPDQPFRAGTGFTGGPEAVG